MFFQSNKQGLGNQSCFHFGPASDTALAPPITFSVPNNKRNPLTAGPDYIRVFFTFFISLLNTSF